MAMLPFPRVMHYYVTCNAIWKWCVAVFHHSWSIILKWISKVLLKTIKFNFTKWGNNRVWCMLVQHHNTITFNIQNINLVWIVYKKVYYCYQHIIMFVLSSILSLISAHVQHSAKKLVEELFPRREREGCCCWGYTLHDNITNCVCGEFLTHPLKLQVFLSVHRGSSARLDARIFPS